MCPIRVKGKKGTILENLDSSLVGNKHQQCAQLAALIQAKYTIVDNVIIPSAEKEWAYELVERISHSPNMVKVAAPMRSKGDFVETPPYPLPPVMQDCYKAADRKVLPRYYKDIDFTILHSTEEKVDEFHTEVRKRSAYWTTFGTSNGRPFRIAALNNARGLKGINAIMGYSRKTRDLSTEAREAIKHVDEALKRFYNIMGYTQEDLGQERSILAFSDYLSSYMGSASGLRPQDVKQSVVETGERLIITPNGKKVDTIADDMDKIMRLLDYDEEPETYWTLVGKVENYFNWDKQTNDEQWKALMNKMRLFNIPTSIFVEMEKLVSKVRMLKERGKVIMIGSKWPKGGADKVAENLGINEANEYEPILVEGDLKNMDQTVHSYFVKLYMETMLIHEDPTSIDYKAKVRILEYLIPRLLVRLTRLYDSVWVQHYGTVPSGCFNTSHMDSWVMGMYFFLFLVIQLQLAPEEDKVELEEQIERVKLVLYGDDHLYNKGNTRVSHYLSAYNFQTWLKQTWDVDLKDIFDGIPFLSVVDRGRVVKRGACFLKQFFVRNTEEGPKQPRYLPFREVNEIMIRAAYGRESVTRTEKEIMLALIGHAYSTYASNRLAYDLLYYSFAYLYRRNKDEWKDSPEMQKYYASKSMRKARVAGITYEEMMKGFPGWDILVGNNEVDKLYHNIREEEFQWLYSAEYGPEW